MPSLDTELIFLDQTADRDLAESLSSRSHAMLACLELARRAGGSPCPVLITGESGVGKSLVAMYVHQTSTRCTRPIVTLRCCDVKEGELRKTLFGWKRAKSGTRALESGGEPPGGLLGRAAGGTLVLKGVEHLSGAMQCELLHILKATAKREPDSETDGSGFGWGLGVRIVGTATTGLGSVTEGGALLDELLFALGEITLRVPPLRKRREDLARLTDLALENANQTHGRMVRGFSRATRTILEHYAFPGNMRELFSIVNQAVRNSDRDAIYVEDLGWAADSGKNGSNSDSSISLSELERHHINKVLLQTGWKKSIAARVLHITETSLARKIKLYGLEQDP